MKSDSKRIAVLGAGITGLTAAFRLVRRGFRVRLFELSARVGGAIRTEHSGEWLIEAGPNSILDNEPAVGALIRELGLEEERTFGNPAARNRYIVRGGRAIAAPLSPPAFFKSPLFSLGAKIRILAELGTRPRVRTGDLSLEQFVAIHFGQEFVDYALNPFVSGVYAGDPKHLSARHAFPKLWEIEQKTGSLLRGQIAAAKARRNAHAPEGGGIFSFRRGLKTLVDALAAQLPEGTLSLHARIEALMPGSPWNVVWNDGAATHTEHFDAVIAALPAPALAQLRFGTLGERPLAALDAMEHPPVSSLFLGYARAAVAHPLDGFGLLVPAVERRTLLGVLFSSTLFPGRAPTGHVALTAMVGGARQPELARRSAAEILAAIEPDLRQLLGVSGPPLVQHHTFWPRAIPQYNLGHGRHLEAMAAAERAFPGLAIGGQARDGISVPACIAAGERLARSIE